MKKIVVLTGAGISAESGIRTFREMGGLWEQYDVMEVASPEGWAKNMELVNRFYNERRTQLKYVKPNTGHTILAELEQYFEIQIVTQNVDNLHERAGSKNVLHLHGELTKVCSSKTNGFVTDIGYTEVKIGDCAHDGSQLRPYIVWFGEQVPAFDVAIDIAKAADIFVIVGTSLNVYPAAGLVHYTPQNIPVFLIDPFDVAVKNNRFTLIQEPASTGVAKLRDILMNKYQ